MKRLWRVLGTTLVSLFVLVVGCERAEDSGLAPEKEFVASVKPTVYVVNYPLQYFAERIAGDMADVVFPAPADEDPAYWTPGADTIAAYQQADLILLNGAAYAKWAEYATLPVSRMVDTSRTFRDRYIEIQGAARHTHGPEGEHAHAGVAFTTWLDPTLAVQHAVCICEVLMKLLPDQSEALARNFDALKTDLESLDARFAELTRGRGDLPLLASHPVYQYFARRYGLNMVSVHWEPDEMPSDRQWSELDELLRAHPARWMIWEAQSMPETIEILRERSIRCVVFDPCGNTPEGADYLQAMKRNIESLTPIFPQS